MTLDGLLMEDAPVLDHCVNRVYARRGVSPPRAVSPHRPRVAKKRCKSLCQIFLQPAPRARNPNPNVLACCRRWWFLGPGRVAPPCGKIRQAQAPAGRRPRGLSGEGRGVGVQDPMRDDLRDLLREGARGAGHEAIPRRCTGDRTGHARERSGSPLTATAPPPYRSAIAFRLMSPVSKSLPTILSMSKNVVITFAR